MKRRITLAAALLVIVASAAGSVVRIAPDEIGATRRGWLAPGWHMRVPFLSVGRLPRAGTVDLGPLEAVTPAGATERISVRLSYLIREDGLPERILARSVASGRGLGGALAPQLEVALGAALRSPGRSIARAGTAVDPLGSALAASLEHLGVHAQSLEWRRTGIAMGPAIAALPPPHRHRVLLIGLDAADWQLIDPLLAEGKLPNLGRLIREGSRAPLRSYDPMISPLLWTTMATGVGPDVHGIADFLVTDTSTGKQIPITSRFRRVKALWNILSEAHLRSGFVGWWASYPAERVDGLLVSDLMGFSLLRPGADSAKAGPGVTYPDAYFGEIRPRMVLPDQITYEDVTRFIQASPEEYRKSLSFKPGGEAGADGTHPVQDPVWLVRRTVAVTRNYETIALDLLSKDLDVVGVYFEGIDLMGHRFQHCMPPHAALCPDGDYARWRDAVGRFYEYQDEVVGRLLAAAPGRTVLVVSDHGFRNGGDRPSDYLPYTTGQPVEWHREYGILILSGPGAHRTVRIQKASVYDVAPTLLYLTGLPAGTDMPGRVLVEALDPEDLAADPPRRIPSYEDVGEAREAEPAVSLSTEAQQEMIENLQALGYVGPIPTPAPGLAAKGGAASACEARPAGDHEGTRVMYHRNLATFYMKTGRYAEAETELLSANRIQPLPKSFELLSESRAARGDVGGAVEYLEQGLKSFPEMDQEAVLWMVDLRVQEGRPELAEELLARWRPRMSRPSLMETCDGKIAAARGEADLAISKFLAALAKEPALVQAALGAAPLLQARGRLAELEPAIAKALSSEKRIDEYQNLLGVIRLEARRPIEALDAIAQALDVDPINPRFLENYSAAALASSRPERAMERYRAALEDPRAGGAVWAGLGRLLGVTRRPAEAARAFARARELGEKSSALYLGYATSLLESGQRNRSREIVTEGLAAHPDDPALLALRRRLG